MSRTTTVSCLATLLVILGAGTVVHAETPSPSDDPDRSRTDASGGESQQSDGSSPDAGPSEASSRPETTSTSNRTSGDPNEGAPGTDDGEGAASGRDDGAGTKIPVDRPESRLDAAESAFQNGKFKDIPPLLGPILEPDAKLSRRADRVRARELLGVGLYFQAQQATDADRRDRLMEKARRQFLELLRERPDYELDALIFPASVVEVFESVRRNHSKELEKIREARAEQVTATQVGESSNTLYIERSIERNVYAWNFFPGGLGQFQNGDEVKGTIAAAGQLAAVGTNVFAYLQIQSLRNADGTFGTRGDPSTFDRAWRWRWTQYISLGALLGVYAWSVVDGISNFQATEVEIRTRDKPPPELSQSSPSTGNPPTLRIGWGNVSIRW